MSSFIHAYSEVNSTAVLGKNCSIWGWSHIRENVELGDEVVVGEHVYVGPGVKIGARSKIQNGSKIYDPAEIEEGVFIGPGAILTNDIYPRAITTNNEQKSTIDWCPVGVKIKFGASIGAGAICVAPVSIGEWSMVAAGSIVVNDVLPFSLVAGNPAKRIKWVGRAGIPLIQISERIYRCPISEDEYSENLKGHLELR